MNESDGISARVIQGPDDGTEIIVTPRQLAGVFVRVVEGTRTAEAELTREGADQLIEAIKGLKN